MEYRRLLVDPEVVVRDGEGVIGVPDLMQEFRENGRVHIITDDTRFASDDLSKRLESSGIAVDGEPLTGIDLLRSGYEGEEAYMFGKSALLRRAGARSSKNGDDVLVGYDPGFSYDKLQVAEEILRSGGSLYVASRRRFTRITGRKPHQSPINEALSEFADPELLGFPSENAMDAVRDRFSFVPEATLLISDRLDLAEAGNRMGVDTAILADESIQERLRMAEAIRRPDYVLSSLHSLGRKLL
nr:MAG: putative sugar phosphatases of the HAD superfamily [Candidatus Nanosalinarum sp. J07AB56]